MSVTQTRNVDYVLVGKTAVTATVASINDLADGQLGVFSLDGTTTGMAQDEKFIIALGGPSSKPKFVSEAIDPAKVEVVKSRGSEVATEQQTHVGFNGTTGSIQGLGAAGYYKVDMYIQEYLTSNTAGKTIKHFQYLAGTAVPTQDVVATNLALSAYNNFKREAEDYVKIEMLMAAGSDTAVGTGVNNVTFTKGSTGIIADGTIDDATGSTALAAGVYIRIGATAADPVYKIVSVNGTDETAVLDRPYVGDTQTLADTALRQVVNASAITVDCGIEIEGRALSFVVGKEQYKKVRWTTLTSEDLGDTEIVNTATAFEGVGTYEQAAEAEWFARGAEGEYARMGEPTIHTSVYNATSGIVYDTTTIRWVEDSVVGFQSNVSPKQITMYSENGVAAMTQAIVEAGVWLSIEAALAGRTGTMSHRDTSDTADTSGSILL